MSFIFRLFKRPISMGRIVPEVEPSVSEILSESRSSAKKLRTRRNMGLVRLPILLEAAAQARIRRVADKKFRTDAKELIKTIYNLKLPDDSSTLKLKKADIKTELELRDKIKLRPDYDPYEFKLNEDIDLARFELNKLIEGTLADRRRDWHYHEYDELSSTLYMATRLPANYACIKTVLNEIRDLDQNFKPKSVIDFGSGMGTTAWAVNETWPGAVSEFMNIDMSKEQQHLCEFLLRGGKEFGHPIHSVFHREYLPVSTKIKYDLVVAAFSMLDLPNSELRTQTIENLWNKTSDILVIIERGNKGGFTIVNEARHFVLDSCGFDVTKRVNFTLESRPNKSLKIPNAHILGPCPHEYLCPRATMTSKKNRDVCRFKVNFEPLDLGEKKTGFIAEEFSYVVLRKKPSTSYFTDSDLRWPRIVERRKHSGSLITHKLCCPNGALAEAAITRKKYGGDAYELAKSCDWGDLLPIKVKDAYVKRSFIREFLTENNSSG